MPTLCAKIGSGAPPANCCEGPPCGLTWRTRSGSYSLCGFAEYASPSIPPKKYRRQDISGTLSRCYGELANRGGEHDAYDGYYLFSASACAKTNTQERDHYAQEWVNCGTEAFQETYTPPADFAPNNFGFPSALSLSASKQVKTWSVVSNDNYVYGGPVTATLNDEDEEDDAIERAGASWSSCSPTVPADCSAYKVARGAGQFSGTYRQLQVKVTVSDTVVGQIYEARIQLQRRVYGSTDPFVDYVELFHQFVGVEGIYTSDWLPVPCESGDEVAAVSCATDLL